MQKADLSTQSVCFLWSLASGVILGFLYSLFYVVRSIKPSSKTLTLITDILFMIFFAFVTLIFSIGFTDGIVRYYVVFGELAGFFVFRFTVGRLIRGITHRIFMVLSKIRGFFQKNISVFSKKLLKARDKMLYNIEKKNHTSMDSEKGE